MPVSGARNATRASLTSNTTYHGFSRSRHVVYAPEPGLKSRTTRTMPFRSISQSYFDTALSRLFHHRFRPHRDGAWRIAYLNLTRGAQSLMVPYHPAPLHWALRWTDMPCRCGKKNSSRSPSKHRSYGKLPLVVCMNSSLSTTSRTMDVFYSPNISPRVFVGHSVYLFLGDIMSRSGARRINSRRYSREKRDTIVSLSSRDQYKVPFP
ncbi:uncharacterized protein CIMG_09695 [Coccidioides immitis RS]|uniref:Uncharacterized protein n=2 Tax=Coccidioides immitis TaxID=5501 RepID=A0A0E1RUW2_COCIM|nr:uncharacterized protein CIMG_09695 [Coccidioides immitis RS]EAS28491.2 hypothetical protein CIMG_09695 [Coccidioides immitis RS]KMP02719.1 hypothetical protein CIRG_02411 [Coccidioides immitis RMSCC 2394]